MSAFSDMLKNYVHEKDVKVGALAHYCNLERSTVYKFINGKREPMSAELVEQIAYFIKLTPLETHQLREAWKMARMGEDAYYIRKSIHHFLCEFQKRERRRRKQVAFIHAFQRVTGWWEVMCQIVSEYIPELHTE